MSRRDEWYAAYPGDVGPFFGFIVDPREAERRRLILASCRPNLDRRVRDQLRAEARRLAAAIEAGPPPRTPEDQSAIDTMTRLESTRKPDSDSSHG